MNTTIIFVYNANSGIFSQLGDLVHKTVSPQTYQCNLCGLTYGGAFMKNEWKEFIQSLPSKIIFLHKDEFLKLYPKEWTTCFPAGFIRSNDDTHLFISSEEINKQKTLDGLKNLVVQKVKNITI